MMIFPLPTIFKAPPCLNVNLVLLLASQGVLVVKNLPANARDARDTSLIPGSGRSSGRGHGNPLLLLLISSQSISWLLFFLFPE